MNATLDDTIMTTVILIVANIQMDIIVTLIMNVSVTAAYQICVVHLHSEISLSTANVFLTDVTMDIARMMTLQFQKFLKKLQL